MISIETNASKASSPNIWRISTTFLYTVPTNGVEGPKIIPRRRDTATNGINNFVNLFRKVVTLVIEVFKFILKN